MFILEIQIDQSLADIGFPGDIVYRGAEISMLGEQADGSLYDLIAPSLARPGRKLIRLSRGLISFPGSGFPDQQVMPSDNFFRCATKPFSLVSDSGFW